MCYRSRNQAREQHETARIRLKFESTPSQAPAQLGGPLLNAPMKPRREGVINFRVEHREQTLSTRYRQQMEVLIGWRRVMFELGLIGQRQDRYDGAGYGNISLRLRPFQRPRGERAFLITGTQTGGRQHLKETDISCVQFYSPVNNKVTSVGLAQPSSESMSHGTLYDLGINIGAVVHVHSSVIWNHRIKLGLPTTPASIEYGTPQMARAIAELWRETSLADSRIFATAGHLDGVFAFGETLDNACCRLLKTYARCHQNLS